MMLKRPLSKIALALGLALVLQAGTQLPARAAMLPRLEADSLGGNHVVLPTDAAGRPLVILLAFTPESEADLKAWSRALLQDHDAAVYVVVVADRQAFMSRNHIRSIVQRSAVGTPDQINSNVLVTFTGAGWQTLVPPGDKRTAGVVVCDANGTVTYARREGFSDARLAEVEHAAK